MSKEERKVPELRFKGFHDDWEQRKFFENIKSVIDYRGRTPKKLNMEWSDTGYLALSALNVKNGFIDKTIDAKYGSEELYKKWMGGNTLSKGFVLFTTEAPMGNVALVPDDDGYILSQRTVAFDTHKDKMTNLFLATTLCTPRVINNLRSLSSGATAKGVSQKSLRALEIIVPEKLEEQRRIGYFLDAIDKIIILHQRKITALEKQKKAYLRKLFPQNDSNIPNLRFIEFTGKWVSYKLGELVDFYSGLTYSPQDISDSGVLVIRSSNIQKNKIVDADNVFVIPNVVNSKTVNLNDIIVVVRNGSKNLIGKHAMVKEDMQNAVIGAFMTGIISESPNFIHALLDTQQFRTEIHKNLGATINQITTGIFKKMSFKVPSIYEQHKVGLIIRQFDDLISYHHEKLNKVKTLKKIYLKKLFI